MPQMPKRVKFRKTNRGVARGRTTRKKYSGPVRGFASRGNYVAYGDYGLQVTEGGWLSAECIESGRITMTRFVSGEGRYYIRVFPHKSITSIPAETRMGKGKGEPEYWAAVVRPGAILLIVACELAVTGAVRVPATATPVPILIRDVRAAANAMTA